MYGKLIVASVATTLLLSGCGGGGSDKGVSFDAQVAYKTSGSYDFRQYLVPVVNSINVYQKDEYENKDGKKRFKGDPERSTYTEKYDINDTKITVKDGRDQIDSVVEIKPDRIIEHEDDNMSFEVARFVEPGDYLLVTTKQTTEEGFPVNTRLACKVAGHENSKKVGNVDYADVLKVTCEDQSEGSNKTESFTVKFKSDGSETSYFAKGIGMIYSESVRCTEVTTTLNGQESTNATCEKEIDTLISHNTL